ncbi:MAG: hypothetical protein Q4C06_06950 [Bacillota bacterium]|nr:hypothetical protein [Bacillota bacterium]
MKKIIVGLLVCLCFLGGCGKKAESFMDISWTRETEADTENIFFGSDGSFRYSCGCGNPVNDADLCEGYTYDEEKALIKLNCMETTEDTVTEIRVVSFDADTLELDFDGEIRRFHK